MLRKRQQHRAGKTVAKPAGSCCTASPAAVRGSGDCKSRRKREHLAEEDGRLRRRERRVALQIAGSARRYWLQSVTQSCDQVITALAAGSYRMWGGRMGHCAAEKRPPALAVAQLRVDPRPFKETCG